MIQKKVRFLKVMEKMTETMAQQMKLSATRADYNMQQNTKIMDQFIRAQDRRDLDPALMDIPTFTGQEPEKCLEWITRIRNVCRQSGRSFQQELTNKSGLVVQKFPIISRSQTILPKTTWWRRSYKCLATYRRPLKR